MSYEFQTTTHGKWILAGEHAVIRGHGALVFPLIEKTLTLTYSALPIRQHNKLLLTTEMVDHDSKDIHPLIAYILEYGLKLIEHPYHDLKGHLHIHSSIPAGVGMGASAALCVAITRWFGSREWIKAHEYFAFAKELEHVFHGESSGLDIAGVSTTTGAYFQNGQISALHPNWQPQWRFTFCGEPSATSDCIQKVQKLWERAPDTASAIDEKMQKAVSLAKQALEPKYSLEHREQLIDAVKKAHECFQDWGLITPVLEAHIQDLYQQGALAVKPTGSGGGGYVLSMWS